MKFKYLIIAFSILIVLFLLITALLPIFVPNPAYTENLRYMASPLLILMSVILVCFGIFFLINYRLFLLLEREDWPALAYYLEQKIFVKNKYNSRYVKLLASSYMVISDYASVIKLENKAFLVKKSVVEKNVLIFGAARVIDGDYKGAADFFKAQLDNGKLRKQDIEWVRWFYGFSCLLVSAFDKAEQEFMSMAVSSGDALITGISAYFLTVNLANKSLKRQDCLAAAETGRKRVTNTLKNLNRWKKELKKTETEIHVAIVRKYINESGLWLFPVSDNLKNSNVKEVSNIKNLENQGSSNQDSSNQNSSNQDSLNQNSE